VWSDTDQKYKDARIIFIDTEKSNWTFDEYSGQYYWHRFYASQPDLNYANPAVQEVRAWQILAGPGCGRLPRRCCPYLFGEIAPTAEDLPRRHQSACASILKIVWKIHCSAANQWLEMCAVF
jgi:maltose alpha-D-glucosyltransferase/alpha-amylase